ncbi:MAG: hypothetical protein ACJATA_000077 [Sphingobacteriales bacterium]|jgi:hypothetical protein
MKNNNEVILSTAYFPPISYMKLVISNDVVIEGHENFVKQTYRNRFRVLGPNGILNLTIPLIKNSGQKTPIQEVLIDNSQNWQALQLRSLESAYRSSPYFEYYFPYVEEFFTQPQYQLFKLNQEVLLQLVKLLRASSSLRLSDKYIEEGSSNFDFRDIIHPKKENWNENWLKYYQVFESKFGFTPDLSILDLIFNLGPDALLFLKKCN